MEKLLGYNPLRNNACRRHSFHACWLLIGLLHSGPERTWAQKTTKIVDNSARTQVVEAAAKALEDRYIFLDLGVAMANRIRQRNAEHAYDALTTETDFSRQLTTDLDAVGHDKHIRVDPNDGRPVQQEAPGPGGGSGRPGPRPGGPGPQMHVMEGPPPPAGVTEFKLLPDGIGYIRVDQMLPANGDSNSIDTAMAALTGVKSLIIDLRRNGGGDPMMVAYLCTYLFPAGAQIHLNDFVRRDDPAPHPSYTLPSVPGKTFAGDVYILTSHFTFSGGEEMAYDLQALKRVEIVGETTGGGANPGGPVSLPDNFSIFIPTGRPINPITKANWEGVGVKPDVPVAADQALETAEHLARKRRRI